MHKFEVSIDGFELIVEIYENDYKSLDFEIENLFDLETNDELDNDFFEMIMEDFEDDIKEDIENQIIAMERDF